MNVISPRQLQELESLVLVMNGDAGTGMAHDVNLVKVKNQNILSHLSQSDKEDLGPLTQI